MENTFQMARNDNAFSAHQPLARSPQCPFSQGTGTHNSGRSGVRAPLGPGTQSDPPIGG